VSSRDRNRNNRQNPAAPASGSYYSDDVVYDDDVLYDDDWVDDGAYDDEPETKPRTQSATTRQSSPIQGTAAQLDRLRRNIGRAGGSGTDRRQPPPASSQSATNQARPQRRPAQPSRPASTYGYQADPYVDDTADESPAPSRASGRPRAAGYRPASQPTPADTTVYYEDDYDDQGYDAYEDEYSDDFSEYDAPVRPPRTARPKPQISLPSMSRPSLPPAIANADLVNDAPALGIIGLGLASLAGMAILVANQVDSLAPSFATHVNASGILEDFASESALWKLPIMAAAFTLMNIAIAWFISPMDRFASRFVLAAAVVVQIIAWVAIIRII
jgi:hypothetical protein